MEVSQPAHIEHHLPPATFLLSCFLESQGGAPPHVIGQTRALVMLFPSPLPSFPIKIQSCFFVFVFLFCFVYKILREYVWEQNGPTQNVTLAPEIFQIENNEGPKDSKRNFHLAH